MNDLGSALRELAGTAQAPHPADPHALWSQGRARVRRRRTGAAAVLVVAVVVGYLGMVRPTPTVVMPAGEPHQPAIPMSIYAPNRFLAGVSDEGAPGQLSVIAKTRNTDEDDLDDNSFWFGISATTGVYTRLDLPGKSSDGVGMALSPDGTRIAYWVTGPTRKKKFGPPAHESERGPLADRPTTGVGVYDLRDGSVIQHQVLTDYGLNTDTFGGPVLSWIGRDALVFSYGVRVTANQTKVDQVYRWGPIGSSPQARGPAEYGAPLPAPPGPGAVWQVETAENFSKYALIDNQARPAGRTFRLPRSLNPDAVTIYGDRVLSTGALWTLTKGGGGTDGISRVLTGELPANDGTVRLTEVPGVGQATFLAWRSPTSVLVAGRAFEDGERGIDVEDRKPGLYQVDLKTAQVSRLGTVDPDLDMDEINLLVAADLADDPYVYGRKPPTLIRALRTEIVIGSLLLVAAGAALYFRPKRRAWRAYLARERERHGAA